MPTTTRFIPVLGTDKANKPGTSNPDHKVHEQPRFLDMESAEDYLVTMTFWYPNLTDCAIFEVPA